MKTCNIKKLKDSENIYISTILLPEINNNYFATYDLEKAIDDRILALINSDSLYGEYGTPESDASMARKSSIKSENAIINIKSVMVYHGDPDANPERGLTITFSLLENSPMYKYLKDDLSLSNYKIEIRGFINISRKDIRLITFDLVALKD